MYQGLTKSEVTSNTSERNPVLLNEMHYGEDDIINNYM